MNPDTCDCAGTGFSGPDCSVPVCNPPCSNGGKCSGPNTCDCAGTGYTNGNLGRCELPVCNPPNGCGNGNCVAPNRCQCFAGWNGTYDCTTPICTKPCLHGVCAGPNSCDCRGTQYTGAQCEKPICDPPCANGGTCSQPNVCDCSTAPAGWIGERCQIPVCDEECQNGGVCSAPNECSCENTGYVGPLCTQDENECQRAKKPCHPLTTCTNLVGNYSCSACPARWTGTGRMDQGGCQPICTEPCQNGGKCSEPDVCNCTRTGYTGPTCSVDLNECELPNSCDPLTNCTNFEGGFNCTACPDGFTGTGKTGCTRPGENSIDLTDDPDVSSSSKLLFFVHQQSIGSFILSLVAVLAFGPFLFSS